MQKVLRDGLILRSISEGVASDRENLPRFYVETFSDAYEQDESFLRSWTESLLKPDHPATTDEDIWVVVDPAKDAQIVSALLLIPQVWRYAGLPLQVGRVELVATHKDYRRRGLIRALFEALHERSEALGHNIQAITGIDHYYRRFGYAMAVDLGSRAAIPLAAIKPPKDDAAPQYRLRPATDADIPHLIAWDEYAARGHLLMTVRSEDEWRFELNGRTEPDHIWKLAVQIIEDAAGRGVGYVAMRQHGHEQWNQCLGWVVGPDSSYLATFENVLQGLKTWCVAQKPEVERPFLTFGGAIPAVLETLMRRRYPATVRDQHYAWYLRAVSPARLICDLAPVLEARLADSPANRYTGELTINLFDLTGLHIKFDGGRISAKDIPLDNPKAHEEADATFAWHTFLNVVFGHRSVEELQYVLPETNANGKARVLFDAMFPRMHAMLMPIS